jgi:hypothetical protein
MPDSLRFVLIMMCLGVSRIWRNVVAFIAAPPAQQDVVKRLPHAIFND